MQTKKKYFFFFIIFLATGTIFFQTSNLNEFLIVNQSVANSWDIPLVLKVVNSQEYSSSNSTGGLLITFDNRVKKEIIITTAVCGIHRINETLVMIKSAIYFSDVKLKFIIFADENTNESLHDALHQKIMTKASSNRHDYEIRPMQFPTGNGIDWKSIFRPCACQRLFLPVTMNFSFIF